MNEAVTLAGAVMMARDGLRRDPPPFAEGCEHDMESLPVVDLRFDEWCRKCGGFRSRYPWQQEGSPLEQAVT